MQLQCVTLANGVAMPQIGLGVYKVAAGDVCFGAVQAALRLGYRHIDTAAYYNNEADVGEAVRQSGIARSELFVTSKVWNCDHGFDKTLYAFDASMQKLQLDYLDLYLIHWPKDDNIGTWRAMERLLSEGRVRAIGVSNFKEHHIDELMQGATVAPMVNQVELHPLLQQPALRAYCKAHGIVVEAWSPLMRGRVFEWPLFAELGQKYGRTPAQIVLRWLVQSDIVVIPKSVHAARMQENADIFSFRLREEDMLTIAALDRGMRTGTDPDNVPF